MLAYSQSCSLWRKSTCMARVRVLLCARQATFPYFLRARKLPPSLSQPTALRLDLIPLLQFHTTHGPHLTQEEGRGE